MGNTGLKRPNNVYTKERIPSIMNGEFKGTLTDALPLEHDYPMMGAADHFGFCQKKLRDTGLDASFFVEVATDRTIQIDYDFPYEDTFYNAGLERALPRQFFDALEIFARMLDVDQHGNPLPEDKIKTAAWRKLKSRSGHTHVIITTSWDIPQAERIAWQAAFGSDFKREALSLAYAAMGQRSPVLLYSRKEEAALIVPILPIERISAAKTIGN